MGSPSPTRNKLNFFYVNQVYFASIQTVRYSKKLNSFRFFVSKVCVYFSFACVGLS